MMNSSRLPRLLPLLKRADHLKTSQINTKTFSQGVLSHTHNRNIDVWVYDSHTEYHIPLYNDIWNAEKGFFTLQLDIHSTFPFTPIVSGSTRGATGLLFPLNGFVKD